jgi:hypothetical protein
MHNDTSVAEEEVKTFVEGVDFYFEDGLMVLTRKYLVERGFCCESGCRHCPFGQHDTVDG